MSKHFSISSSPHSVIKKKQVGCQHKNYGETNGNWRRSNTFRANVQMKFPAVAKSILASTRQSLAWCLAEANWWQVFEPWDTEQDTRYIARECFEINCPRTAVSWHVCCYGIWCFSLLHSAIEHLLKVCSSLHCPINVAAAEVDRAVSLVFQLQ